MSLKPDQLRERLRAYASEFNTLAQMNAPRDSLLNGDGTRHGLNHLNEIIMMLPPDRSGEFIVKDATIRE